MKIDRGLRARLSKAGQEFLADHCEQLDDKRGEKLLHQLEKLDLEEVERLRSGAGRAAPPPRELRPLPYVAWADRDAAGEAAERGRRALREGSVAFALLAGGQASRLRWDGPKGTYPIGPVSQRSLFQILAEHLVRAGRDHGHEPPLAITTSATTDAAIRTYFERKDLFGLDRDRIRFARQTSLPALDREGRLMLAAPERIFTSPDGHGGAMKALETSGVLAHWEELEIRTVVTFQVDNPLLRVVDPDFIGRLLEGDDEISTKVILKQRPEQKLGVVVEVDGRPAIVEYSEISEEQARQRDADGQLTYRLGSIAVHAFRLDFLRDELSRDLPLHTARKEIPCVDRNGSAVRRPGVKYERFLFDLFPRARSVRVVEVLPDREYSPVKNAEGPESPETTRRALDAEYRRWYQEAGLEPPSDPLLELSPIDALGPADLRRAAGGTGGDRGSC